MLEELHRELQPVLSGLNLGAEGIRYYAGTVIKSEIFQLTRRSDEDRHVHVIAFIAHQYYRLQDNLVDVLLNVVKNAQNSAQREHKERVYDRRKIRNQAIKSLLSRLDKDFFNVFRKIRNLVQNKEIGDSEKLEKISQLLADIKEDDVTRLQIDIGDELDECGYYSALESKSLRLQNRASPILKELEFQAEPGAKELLRAIDNFKKKSGAITASAPLGFLDNAERKAVEESEHQKFRTSLYKTS